MLKPITTAALMRARLKGISFAIVAAAIGGWSQSSQATTFTFDDIVFVSGTNAQRTNGPANFAAAFPGYTGSAGYSSAGYYQVLQTGNKQFWSGLTPLTNPTPTYIFKSPGITPVAGEWIQNDPLFPAYPPLNGTESEDKLVLQGFGAPAVNGTAVDKVWTTSTNGSYFEFTSPTGNGIPTTFTFNSFDLSGSATGVSFEVLNSSFGVIYTSPSFNLTSATQHVTVNIPGAYKVLFNNGSSVAGALNVDNIEINDPITTAAPEPASIALLGAGLVGLGAFRRRRKGLMRRLAVAIAIAVLAFGSAAAKADTVTNIDLTPYYNGNWSTATNGPAIVAGVQSGTGNAGTGLNFQDPTAAFAEMFWNGSGTSPNSITISPLAIALGSSSVVNALFNNFFGSTNQEATVVFTNSNSDTASFNLIGGQTIRDYNNDGFVNTITGSNSNPADGDVTTQVWWSADTGGTNPGTPGSPSSRLDAQTFHLPASWNGTDLTSIQVTDTDTINADLILTALQLDVAAPAPNGVPEPGSMALLGTALIGIGAIRRRGS